MNSEENEYNVRFYYDGKLMKSYDIQAKSVGDATRIALGMVDGWFSWNEIAVDQYGIDKGEDDIS